MEMKQKPSEQPWQPGSVLQAPVEKSGLPFAERYIDAVEVGEEFVPVEPKFAATVLLVRQATEQAHSEYVSTKPAAERKFPANGVEVFMIRRQKSMDFVPDVTAFPGGRVDPADSDPNLPWAGPSPAEWAEYLGKPEEVARCILVAAVREVFEETGVLLAGEDAQSVVKDVTGPEWQEERRKLVEHEQCFAAMLIRRNLVIRTDLLRFNSNWCTPLFGKKRFDTFFFIAQCPDGQNADDLSREAYIADWVDPEWVIEMGDAGTLALVPPTIYNLGFVGRAESIEALMATKRPVVRIMSEARRLADGTVVVYNELP